ncbi:beta strand repeat-containing protein [Burkholderia cepacia]|uniref:beta strand repeat-containing protein n=1 Tax=Burkholderia cepacia TaxID=292 RepID=UPI003D670A43
MMKTMWKSVSRASIAFAALAVSIVAHAQFVPGQILTAFQLNAALAAVLPLAGGTLSGPLTVPTLSVSGSATIPFTAPGPNTVSRTVQAKLAETVSILDTGAKADGSTDDSSAVTKAAAIAARVFVPNGTTVIQPSVLAATQDQLYGPGMLLVAGSSIPAGDIHTYVTLNVPSQFASVQAALDFLGTRAISKTVMVVVKVADGTYNWTNIEPKSPFGDQIQVIGNVVNPANVVINVDNRNGNSGFVFYRGHRLNLVDGFTINGVTGWVSHGNWTGAAGSWGAAFYAVEAGSGAQIGSNIRINKLYYGLLADHAASFTTVGAGGLTVNEAGDVGMLARWSGSIDAQNTTVTNAADTQQGAGNLGCGYMAEAGGTIRADGSTTSGNLVCGFGAQTGGSAWYHSVTASNSNFGLYANGGGSIDSSGVVVTGGVNGVQSNDNSHIYTPGTIVSGTTGAGFNATNLSEINLGSGATANSNPNGFTQYNNSYIYGTMNGTGNTYQLFINGNTINSTPIGATTPSTGAFTTLSASGAATLNTLSSSGATITGGSINGTPVGNSAASTGAFTTLSASGTVSGAGFSSYLASPPAIGGTAAAAGTFSAMNVKGAYSMWGNVTLSNISPTISSGFGTSPSIVDSNGGAAFRLNVGSGGTASSGTVTLAAASHAWVCQAQDVTTTSASVFVTKMTASTSTSVTFTNFNTSGAAAAWAANDILYISCVGD